MSNAPSNTDDVIDSREIIERIEELTGERDALIEDRETAQQDLDDAEEPTEQEREALQGAHDKATDALVEWTEENGAELAALEALQEQAEGYSPDWPYGATLIRDSYFRAYAQEMAEELDLVKPDAQWPYTCIDWDQAARELQMDYTSVDFDGVTYWVR